MRRVDLVGALVGALAFAISAAQAAAPRPAVKPRLAAKPPVIRPELVLQTGHADRVNGFAWSQDGASLATLAADGKVLIWDVPRGLVRRELPAQPGPPVSVAWSPDGRVLATGHGDGAVVLWDPDTGKPTERITLQALPIAYLAWSPDGTTLAAGGWLDQLHLRDVAHRTTRSIKLTANAENSFAWNPDGSQFALGNAVGRVETRDTATGQVRKQFAGQVSFVSALLWSPDGKRLSAGSWDGSVRTWDSASGKEVGSFKVNQDVLGLAWVGAALAVPGDHQSVSLREVETGKELSRLEKQGARVTALGLSPRGDRLAVGNSDGGIRLWDTAQRRQVGSLVGAGHPIYCASWDPNTQLIASAGWYGATRIWDSATGEAIGSPSGHLVLVQTATWGPDGATLALGGAGVEATPEGVHTRNISLWDRRTRRTLREGRIGDAPWLNCLDFSRDGKRLAAGDMRGGLFLVDPSDLKVLHTLEPHKDEVRALRFSPDGKLLASAASDGTARIWDGETGAALHTLQSGDSRVRALCWSPDGKRIATGDLYGSVRIWDASSYALLREVKTTGVWVDALAFSPDGATLASGSADGAVRFWDPATGALTKELRGHTGEVGSVTWSPTGDRLLTAGWDGSVRIWLLNRGSVSVGLVPVQTATGDNDWLAITADGFYDGSEAGAQRVTWRVGRELFPAARYEARFHRPGVVRRFLAGDTTEPAPLDAVDIPPGVQFVSPQSGSESRDAAVEVELFAADDRSISEAELFVNGRPLAPADAKPLLIGARGAVTYGPPTPDGSRPIMLGAKPLLLGAKPLLMGAKSLSNQHHVGKTFRFHVPMPPGADSVTVRAVVYDDQGYNSEPAEIVIRRSGAPDVKGALYAVCVGVSKYGNPAYNLKYARQDADAMAGLLEGQKALYREVKVTRLLDADATSAHIRDALAAIRRVSRPSDTVILFLSGHGVEDGEGRYYFASHEVDPKALATTSVTVAQLQSLLGGTLRARSVFVFADTCHSGGIPARPASNNRLEALKTVVLASSQGGEFSFERDEWGHGAFTYALLEGLAGKAEPGSPVVHFDALAFYVRKRVQELVGGAQQVTVAANGVPLGTPVAQN